MEPKTQLAYQQWLAFPPNFLRAYITKELDNIIVTLSTNPSYMGEREETNQKNQKYVKGGVYNYYLTKLGQKNLIEQNISIHSTAVSRQQLQSVLNSMNHSDLCKFMVREHFLLPGKTERKNVILNDNQPYSPYPLFNILEYIRSQPLPPDPLSSSPPSPIKPLSGYVVEEIEDGEIREEPLDAIIVESVSEAAIVINTNDTIDTIDPDLVILDNDFNVQQQQQQPSTESSSNTSCIVT